MFADDDETFDSGLVDPWGGDEPDIMSITGADWYLTALTASVGGLQVHGLNCSPATEVLAIVDEDFCLKHSHARIKMREQEADIPEMDEDPAYAPYTGHSYHGHTSSAHAALAFDTGVWEPSIRTRAKEAAVVASLIDAQTGDYKQAVEVASAIVGEKIPEEAIAAVALPISALKREVISTAKARQSIFSRSTYQRAIVWEDQNLVNSKLPPTAAVDWARVTAIARYIGEINFRYDPNFRRYAATRGVPFMLVSGAWAFVSTSDYLVDPTNIPKVPNLELASFAIPSLKDAFSGHSQDLLATVSLLVQDADPTKHDVIAASLMRIIEGLVEQRKVKVRTSRVMPGTDQFEEIKSHTRDAASAARAVADSGTAWNALVEATSTVWKSNKTYQIAAESIVARKKVGRSDPSNTDERLLGTTLCPPTIWIDAANQLARTLGNPDSGFARMSKLRRATFGSSCQLEHTTIIHARNSQLVFSQVRRLATGVVLTKAPKPPNVKIVFSAQEMKNRQAVHSLAAKAATHLTSFKEAWHKRYEDWARVFARTDVHKSVLYAGAALAFKNLSLADVLLAATRFVDCSVPRKTYLAQMAESYARKRRLNKPNLPLHPMSGPTQIAELLDRQYRAEVSFVDVEAWVFDRLAMFASDLAIGDSASDPSDDAPGEVPVVVSDNKVPDDMEDFMGDLMGDTDVSDLIAPSYSRVVATYRDEEQANSFARANGYGDFAAAWSALGDGARFDPETTFSQTGLNAEMKKETIETAYAVLE